MLGHFIVSKRMVMEIFFLNDDIRGRIKKIRVKYKELEGIRNWVLGAKATGRSNYTVLLVERKFPIFEGI